ncbi:MAG: hypothetical protein ACKO34_02220 [Vampirovibrionales bacterium]
MLWWRNPSPPALPEPMPAKALTAEELLARPLQRRALRFGGR